MLDYSLHGLAPGAVLSPTSVDALAAELRRASADGAGVVPWGSGTRQQIGCGPSRYDLALRTAALDQIVEYEPADLVVTTQAGVSLGALQGTLAQHSQRLPWDPPAPPEATVGGLLASGAVGPLRLGYGGPRDWTLGMQVVLGDGRPVRSGGKVVKNVAGYDAHKLHLGALGTLGVIVEVTFKLSPLPECQRTLLLRFPNRQDAFAALKGLRKAPLAPVSLLALNQDAALAAGLQPADLQQGQTLVAARFAGVPAAVERLIALAAEGYGGLGVQIVDGSAEETLWAALAGFARGGEGVLLRAGVRPGLLPQLGAALERPAAKQGWAVALLLYGGVGLAYARWLPPTDAGDAGAPLAVTLRELRQELATLGGYAVVEDAPPQLRPGLDIWGPAPEGLALMQALKRQWDGRGVLNPGRYVTGL